MTELLIVAINVVACLCISLACWSFLLAAHGRCGWSIAANVGFLLAGVGAFIAAFVPYTSGELPQWWALMLRAGVACIAIGMYERRFGMGRQLRALFAHVFAVLRRFEPLLRGRPEPEPTELDARYDALKPYAPPHGVMGANHEGREL